MNWLYHTVRYALIHWGYLAVVVGLLGESAGLPLPGETVLMFASFLAHKTSHLLLQWVIVGGIAAAMLGDNLGFLMGRWLGPHLIRWMENTFGLEDDIALARDQIEHHGAETVFWARYIFGLRTIAGPVAGALGMAWKKFLLYNVLGAATWVTAIALCGYEFANKFQTLLGFFEKASWIIEAAIFVIGYILWSRKKRRLAERGSKHKKVQINSR